MTPEEDLFILANKVLPHNRKCREECLSTEYIYTEAEKSGSDKAQCATCVKKYLKETSSKRHPSLFKCDNIGSI